MFKRNRVYSVISSAGNYYRSTLPYNITYVTFKSPLGTYCSPMALYQTDPCPSGTCGVYNAQSSFVLKVPGKRYGYIYGGDRWNADGANLYSSRQVWLPLLFRGPTIVQAESPHVGSQLLRIGIKT